MKEESVIGIDLGATNIRVGKVADGAITALESEKIREGRQPSTLLNQIGGLIEKVSDTSTAAIGMGVPSVVDVEKGIVYDVQNIPGWEEVPVKSIFEERFGMPVFVNNDANCFALGEKYFGKGHGYDSVIGVILGTGFAAGLVLDGRLYTGKHCGAGEVGMIPYRDSIYEFYCSAQFFEREYGIAGEKVFERAQKGDAEALAMFEAFGRHLGNGLKTVLYAYDPEVIVFGGSVRHAYSYFEEAMWQSLGDFSFARMLESVSFEISEHEHIAVLGAAAIALEMMDN